MLTCKTSKCDLKFISARTFILMKLNSRAALETCSSTLEFGNHQVWRQRKGHENCTEMGLKPEVKVTLKLAGIGSFWRRVSFVAYFQILFLSMTSKMQRCIILFIIANVLNALSGFPLIIRSSNLYMPHQVFVKLVCCYR